MRERVASLVSAAAKTPGRLWVGDPQLAADLAGAGFDVTDDPIERQPDASLHGIVLAADELGHAGDRAEVLVDESARALVGGGLLVVTAESRMHLAATGARARTARPFTAAEVVEALHHRGFEVEHVEGVGVDDPLLADAAHELVAVARSPVSERARSTIFFETLPTKLVAAAVVCLDPDGRLLVVHDAFKHHWTIPGGVVDAGEHPGDAARREAWEEAGTRVEIVRLIGLFHELWPDRLHLLYEAVPLDPEVQPDPVHTHEVDEVAWLPLEEALARLTPHMAARVRSVIGRDPS